MLTISKNIRKLREQRGISQDKLSKLADISLNTIAKLELDETQNPTVETLQKISNALKVKIEDLVKQTI